MPVGKFNARLRAPKCRNCGSVNITATSSQQFRMINGKRRQAADAVCNDCGNQWWSVNPRVRAMARAADIARKVATLKSGKKQKTTAKAGYSARVVETKAPRLPKGWSAVRKNAKTNKNAGAGKRSRIAQGAAGPVATMLPDRIKPRALNANLDLRRR